jgi:hypothetical protein
MSGHGSNAGSVTVFASGISGKARCATGKIEAIDELAYIEAERCNGRIRSAAAVLDDPEIEEIGINEADRWSSLGVAARS